ncbi:hypothetical protein BCV72DRAFT_243073 [Rhizopus microsporus var. microsporus]|uniref:Uncharacterized protein n=2 Tax=Rhizopus microsporus TaxID=58291 RepID=A0A2G4SEP4_RHIZD|nr:uncharacterized protein RHIMIDRAFT_242854 [Rhizopus microsporus ATCC 52813]XP_023469553.1 uncharacterized protein RHIMIDRAFT_235183 [Rhizopus microsporus ATCC 52813]ORE05096.1 hypothetical protein BCV72DRAFT_243073 [Rhizopus microsporus var. microsporus]PHZ07257.1 hypothetical protein RHIMIDRAFT_242854 [Rhizopus microsporus ATCC 52813]PHZ15845.1 hypothetical protein RHIMIDRAFT_235183 [Rhizopus microsporus ATCC 52813]
MAGCFPVESKEIAELNEVIGAMIYDTNKIIHNEAIKRCKDLAKRASSSMVNMVQKKREVHVAKKKQLLKEGRRYQFLEENAAEEEYNTQVENDFQSKDKEIAQKKELKILSYFDRYNI